MNRLTLKFSNPNLEKAYINVNRPFAINSLFLCFKLEIMFSCTMLLIIILKYGVSTLRIISLLGVSSFFLLFFILKKYVRQAIFQFFLIILCFFLAFVLAESIHNKENNNSFPDYSIMIAISFQFFLNLTLLTRLPWYYSFSGYVVDMIYLLCRIVNSSDNLDAILIGALLLMFMFGLISYRHEKTYRGLF